MTRAVAALLACIGRRPGVPNENSFAGFDDRDWQELVETARRHRLTALLYQRLHAHGHADRMPVAAREALRTWTRSAAQRALRLQAELSAVGKLLHAAGIPVIVLKGGHLANVVYEDAGLRWMGDLDLLVPRTETMRALETLHEAGFRPHREASLDTAFAEHHHATPMTRAGCTIELHWSPVPPSEPFGVDADGLWRRSRPLGELPTTLRVLSIADLLVHLCVHAAGSHHLLMGLQPLVDVTEVCRSCEVDWSEVQDVATEWRAGRPVSLMCQLARVLLGARVPSPTNRVWRLAACEPALVDVALADVVTQTIGPLPANVLRLGRLSGGWQRLTEAVTTSLARSRVAHIYGLELNSWRVPAYQLRRAVDVLWRHGPNLVRLGMDEGSLRESSGNRARLHAWLRAG